MIQAEKLPSIHSMKRGFKCFKGNKGEGVGEFRIGNGSFQPRSKKPNCHNSESTQRRIQLIDMALLVLDLVATVGMQMSTILTSLLGKGGIFWSKEFKQFLVNVLVIIQG